MPGSTVSLESLSSPSPSPPPLLGQHDELSGAPVLDSGSELSELTEEEQDNDSRAKEDDASRTSTRKKKQRGHIVPEPMWDWAVKKKRTEKKDKDWRSYEEEEEEEQPGPARAMEEEEDDDQDKGLDSDRDVSPGKDDAYSDNEVADDDDEAPPEEDGESGDETPLPPPHHIVSGEVSGEEGDEPEDADLDAPDVQQSPKAVASPDLTDDENEQVGEDELEDDDGQDAELATKERWENDEEEDDAVPDDVDVPDADEAPTTEAVTPAPGVEDAVDADPDAAMDVDAPQAVLMSPVAVAASSIMGGASLIRPVSASASQPSTPSASRASSRYPSAEPEQEQDVSEPEAEPERERKATTARSSRTRKGKTRTRAPRRSRAAAPVDPGDVDADPEQADLQEGDAVDGEDDLATPEIDLDSDMQPAHRAEALDVLAAIELKFALLRERLYVEKMDSLAWEEGLIADGTHPELLHLHTELSSRRDKRLELAARRRDYEVENVRKRRRLDESGTWSTWKHDRDELQKTMIAEANGRKRKLERERKLVERPPPARRFPMPLHDVPPAPTLRDIVKSSPLGLPESALSLTKRGRKKEASMTPLAYPTIAPLSRQEIHHDLELFYSHQHNVAYNAHQHMQGPGLMLGGGLLGMDPYAMGMQIVDGPGPYVPPMQPQHLQQQGMLQGFVPPRLPHHHSAPPGGIPHLSQHAQMQMEQEMQAAMRHPSGMPQHPSQFGPGPGPGPMMRRSISPVPLNGAGPSSSVPTTLGGGPIPPGFTGPKSNGWTGQSSGGKESKRVNGDMDRDRERMTEVLSQRERERERTERDRVQRGLDREREIEADRAYHASHTQPQRHGAHPHAHPHVHGNPQGHHHPHQHHHHHVHHHHHAPLQGFNGPGNSAHAPPMAGLPSGVGGGPASQSLSPHGMRDFDQRRPRSSTATELIELSVSTPKQHISSPRMSAFWQGNEEPLPLPNEHQRERDRERGRATGPLGPPQHGSNERMMTPFTMGPSQTLQRSLPGSPPHRSQTNAGSSSHIPPSMPSSRRGSWSAVVEDHGHPRSAAVHPGTNIPSGAQRPPARLPPPPTSYHSPFGSPHHSNGRASPHAAPYPGPLTSPGAVRTRDREPGRVPLGGPLSPPPSLPLSPRGTSSPGPKTTRPPSPGLPKAALPKLGGFPIPESGNIAPIATATASVSSGALPPLSAGLGGAPPRMSLAEKVAQAVLPAVPVPQAVDGS